MSRTPDFSALTIDHLGAIQPKDVIVIPAPVKFLSETANKIARQIARWLYVNGTPPSVLVAVLPLDWTIERIPEEVMATHGWVRERAPRTS